MRGQGGGEKSNADKRKEREPSRPCVSGVINVSWDGAFKSNGTGGSTTYWESASTSIFSAVGKWRRSGKRETLHEEMMIVAFRVKLMRNIACEATACFLVGRLGYF